MPCDRCLEIVSHTINRDESRAKIPQWQTDTWGLVESAKTCECCQILWNLFMKPELVSGKGRYRVDLVNSRLPVCLQMSNTGVRKGPHRALWSTIAITVEAQQRGRVMRRYGLIAVSVEDKVEHPDYCHPRFWTLGRTAPSLTIAEDRMHCAKEWLEACEKEPHFDCQPMEGFLPTKLIDVRANQVPCLVETHHLNGQKERVRYATLSHCWGPPGATGPLKTTRQTAEEFGKEIPETMLPRTFRDAIRITRFLGIPFLWIDSLCIVQDDPDEWQREASRMKDVYSGSVLTISASYGRDSSSGCLPEDDKPMQGLEGGIEARPSSSFTNKDDLGIFSYDYRNDSVNRQQNVMVRLQAKSTQRQLEDAHLSTRGWACQEHIVSGRTLHCLDSEIHWQCRRAYHTQSGCAIDEGDPSCEIGLASSDKGDIWSSWIQDYTSRDFTISSDRMAAFYGISEYYRAFTGQEVLLGVCRESLAKDLSWVRVDSEKGPADTGAPSWSWLSCNAPVCLDYFRLEDWDVEPQICTFAVDCHVSWTGPAMTSAIQATMFRVRGPVVQMTLRISPESLNFNPPDFLISPKESNVSKKPISRRCVGQFDHESHAGDVETEYTCLLLFSGRNECGTKQETFLLLLPNDEVDGQIGDMKSCDFHRVGIAMIKGTERMFSGAQEKTLDLS